MKITLLQDYPVVDERKVDDALHNALIKLNRKIVVLDDDPTGVQTVHGVSVYTGWDESALEAGFLEDKSMFFVLTNSRSFSAGQTKQVHKEIGETLCRVSEKTGKDYILISRGDSTLRGHYPLETETLRQAVEGCSSKRFDGEIIFPFFKEGGRYTVGNVHYVRDADMLVPAGKTEFAGDKSFGYKSSHLGEYVEEKTGGVYKKEDCTYISLNDLRSLDIEGIEKKLLQVSGFGKVIVNAINEVDVKIFTIAYIGALRSQKEFLFRSAAAVPKVLGGVSSQPLLTRDRLIGADDKNGGIVLIGSHVNKTTQQFEDLRNCKTPLDFIEFNQHLALVPNGLAGEVERVVGLCEKRIAQGGSVVVFTRRERLDLDTDDKDEQLKISVQISDAVTSVIGRLSVRPSFIIAKGGITSSDVGTKALRVKRALIMGQIKPGIPVWMTFGESKFPDMPYIIFPGNVGDKETLREIVDLLNER